MFKDSDRGARNGGSSATQDNGCSKWGTNVVRNKCDAVVKPQLRGAI
jgi:hypothetical protein